MGDEKLGKSYELHLGKCGAENDQKSSEAPNEEANGSTAEVSHSYLSGMRLHVLTLAVFLSVFLVNFEISVVSTSLVSIVDDLHGFGRGSWVITAYLLSYAGFMVILAKLSDNFGRKTVLLTSVAIFAIASGGCGAAQTLEQLIVLRAFQGLGASGVYSLAGVVIFEMVPQEKYPKYAAYIAGLFATSLLCGPLIGGAINQGTTWRWVFLLNVPVGALGFAMLVMCLPANFPYHGNPSARHYSKDLRKVDVVGAAAMLTALITIIIAFEEVSNFAPWASPNFLAPFLVSLPTLLFFLGFERRVTLRDDGLPEPMFPWRFMIDRVIGSLLLNAFLVGGVFTSCIIQIPIRSQVINDESSWRAGVRLVPFGVGAPIGVAFTAALCGKRRLPPVYLGFAASIFQIIGLICMSQTATTIDNAKWRGQYGLQFLAGLGCGLSMGVTQLTMPFAIVKRDLATATSAVVQLRILGGVIILAIVTAVMNSDLKRLLASLLSPAEIMEVFRTTESIQMLDLARRIAVQEAFLRCYNRQLRILVGIAVAEIPATLLMWRKEQVRVA